MPKVKISEFSATPANNTDIDGINIAEGCAPSGINDAIRELMAQLKDWQSGTSNDPYVVGSSGSLTVSYGTANGVPYLNGSKVLTTGSALTFDGSQLDIPAGSAGTPSLSTIADPNTGIFFPAADTIAFSEGGVEAMRIDSSGNVGIGTSSPSAPLTVNGTFAFAASGNGVIRRAQVNGSSGVKIQGNDNDTINDTNPGASIAIGGGALTDTFEGNITLTAYGNTAGGTRNNIIFSNRSGTNTVTERARIDSSGNLLVGTTSTVSGGGVLQVSNGITFPATQSASSNANTLDDYEEGTFTPNQGGGLTVIGTFSSTGTYTKIGNLVNVQVSLSGSTSIAIGGADAIIFTNLPFTTANRSPGEAINIGHTAGIFTSTASSTVYSCGALAATTTIFLSITYRV
jgi:hypothetical protein